MNPGSSPFKFLDAYTREDREIFFGREREIEELYQKVFESKVLLLYGISGTGKTSLINCGLANKFEDSDWLPVNIRRGTDINRSFKSALSRIALTPVKSGTDPVKTLHSIYLDHFKPVYLIFDQFEELFIFGDRQERDEFINTIKNLIESDVQCRMIFSIREEYLASVTEFESRIRDFLNNRMRIERMTLTNAIEVIEGPCRVHGIEVEKGFADSLLTKLNPASSEIELTYLQVFLDKLLQLSGDSKQFGLPLLEQVGDVSDLLGSFLEEQINGLEDPDAGLTVLKAFVSMQGTKKQITEEEIEDFLKTFGQPLEVAVLTDLLQRFVNLRLLRDKDESDRYELRHDSLAMKIFEKITLVEKELLEINSFIENAYRNFEKRKIYLSGEDLKYIAPYEDKLFMKRPVESFIYDSKRHYGRAQRRRRNILTTTASLIILILAGFTIWALSERRVAKENYIKSHIRNQNLVAGNIARTDPTVALRILEHTMKIRDDEDTRKNMIELYRENNFYKIIAKSTHSFTDAKFSPDGRYILTGSWDRTARLWDHEGNEIAVLRGHKGVVGSVDFSPDGKYILTGSGDGTVRLWNLEGDSLGVYRGTGGSMDPVTFSPDGNYLLSGSYNGDIYIWDLNGKLIQVLKGIEGNYIFSIDISPDGDYIISGSRDMIVRLWDLRGNEVATYKCRSGSPVVVGFSPNTRSILLVSPARIHYLDFSLKEKFSYNVHESSIRSAVVSSDGHKVLVGLDNAKAVLMRHGGEVLGEFVGHTDQISAVAFSPDEKTILTASRDKTTRVWHSPQGFQVKLFNNVHDPWVLSAAGHQILGTSKVSEKSAILIDIEGNELKSFHGHEDIITSLAMTSDGKFIAAGSKDNTARLWDLDGSEQAVFKGHRSRIGSVAISPDGNLIATGSWDKTARLWNREGVELCVIPRFNSRVNVVEFSRDGEVFLAGSMDGSILIINMNGNVVSTLTGHTDGVADATFSPCGNYILSGSNDRTARLWSREGKELMVFKGHSGDVQSVTFSPDGKYIITGSEDETARVWDKEGNTLQLMNVGVKYFEVAYPTQSEHIIILRSFEVELWEIRTLLEDFQAMNYYEELSIPMQLEFNLINFEDIITPKEPVVLYSLAESYFQKATDEGYDINIEELEKSLKVYDKLISIEENSKYMVGRIKVLQQLQKAGWKGNPEKKIDRDFELLLNLDDPDQLLSAGNFIQQTVRQYPREDRVVRWERIIKSYKMMKANYPEKNVDGPLSTCYARLSLDLLYLERKNEALEAALIADSLRGNRWKKRVLLMAYLLNDQYVKAEEIFIEYSNLSQSDQNFGEMVISDLNQLTAEGISHPDFERIRELYESQ